jgi:hypothetical protein
MLEKESIIANNKNIRIAQIKTHHSEIFDKDLF